MVLRVSFCCSLFVISAATLQSEEIPDALSEVQSARKPGASLDSAVLYETTHGERRRIMVQKQILEDAERKYRYALEISSDGDKNRAAVRHFEDFLILFPDHPRALEVRMELARIYSKRGQTQSSIQMLESVIAQTSDLRKARAMLMLGRIQRTQGNIQQAVDWFDRLQNQYPNTEEARKAELESKSIRFLDSERYPDESGGQSRTDGLDSNQPVSEDSVVNNEGSDESSQNSDPLDLMGEGIETQ